MQTSDGELRYANHGLFDHLVHETYSEVAQAWRARPRRVVVQPIQKRKAYDGKPSEVWQAEIPIVSGHTLEALSAPTEANRNTPGAVSGLGGLSSVTRPYQAAQQQPLATQRPARRSVR
jgi:hypothetical protein